MSTSRSHVVRLSLAATGTLVLLLLVGLLCVRRELRADIASRIEGFAQNFDTKWLEAWRHDLAAKGSDDHGGASTNNRGGSHARAPLDSPRGSTTPSTAMGARLDGVSGVGPDAYSAGAAQISVASLIDIEATDGGLWTGDDLDAFEGGPIDFTSSTDIGDNDFSGTGISNDAASGEPGTGRPSLGTGTRTNAAPLDGQNVVAASADDYETLASLPLSSAKEGSLARSALGDGQSFNGVLGGHLAPAIRSRSSFKTSKTRGRTRSASPEIQNSEGGYDGKLVSQNVNHYRAKALGAGTLAVDENPGHSWKQVQSGTFVKRRAPVKHHLQDHSGSPAKVADRSGATGYSRTGEGPGTTVHHEAKGGADSGRDYWTPLDLDHGTGPQASLYRLAMTTGDVGPFTAVPEPGSLVLLSLALGAVFLCRKLRLVG